MSQSFSLKTGGSSAQYTRFHEEAEGTELQEPVAPSTSTAADSANHVEAVCLLCTEALSEPQPYDVTSLLRRVASDDTDGETERPADSADATDEDDIEAGWHR